MSKILITGASGFLGTKLFNIFSSSNEVIGTFMKHGRRGLVPLDITDPKSTHELILKTCPELVIHTVALSDPDICEQRKEDAERINYFGTRNIVDAVKEIGAKVVYISTVYVFDGVRGDYKEDDSTNPINWYGVTKLRAESEVMKLPHSVILRFDKLYGFNTVGSANDDLGKILVGKPFGVNMDQKRQPLLIDDVGNAILKIHKQSWDGIFHLAGPERMTKYELTKSLAQLVGRESIILPIPEKQQIARRPRNASIVTNKAQSLGILFTPFETALRLIDTELKNQGIESPKRKVESK